jgi:hypothetical protein
MKRKVAGLGVVVFLGMAGCGDITEPDPVVEARVAHVAPGAGSYQVALDGRPLVGAIAPLQYAYVAVRSEQHIYVFENEATSLSVETPIADITAVLLMNEPEPELRSYPLPRVLGEQHLVVINADTAASDLVVLLETPSDTIAVTLQAREGEQVALGASAYTVRVHRGEVAEAETVQGFTLQTGDHGFLVIYPADSETARYGRFLF